ncbi:hypothetical protein [Pseudonocardia sp. GCM10023141]|uniref:hypothetical protein n=1 Tax=Pseudonocardia sp. GCM10023141 TaxID=3252653 RepID=UPI00361074F4
MLFTVALGPTAPDGHAGFVAGRYRDGAFSDAWTDVRRCAERTFTAYHPGCTCGWTGAAHPASDIGWHHCRRAWLDQRFRHLNARAAHNAGGDARRPATGCNGSSVCTEQLRVSPQEVSHHHETALDHPDVAEPFG